MEMQMIIMMRTVFPEIFLESYSSFRCHEKAIIHSLTSDIK